MEGQIRRLRAICSLAVTIGARGNAGASNSQVDLVQVIETFVDLHPRGTTLLHRIHRNTIRRDEIVVWVRKAIHEAKVLLQLLMMPLLAIRLDEQTNSKHEHNQFHISHPD